MAGIDGWVGEKKMADGQRSRDVGGWVPSDGGQGLLVVQCKHCVHTLSATTTKNNIGIGNAV